MRRVTYAMNVSLDGYIVGPDGGLDWGGGDAQVFQFWIERTRALGTYLLGRRLYEAMLYWENPELDPPPGSAEREWIAVWRALPKVVFSTSLATVQGHARLAAGGLAEEIARLRADPAGGDIAVGGATLAAQAAGLDLIDEYHAIVYPVLVGGGIPFFPQHERHVDLELLEARTIGRQVVSMRHQVTR